jgi:hypothetical protein
MGCARTIFIFFSLGFGVPARKMLTGGNNALCPCCKDFVKSRGNTQICVPAIDMELTQQGWWHRSIDSRVFH